jgi:cellulose synthase/poly-beta-1,6-N-acetylglucosamine synthase-like glycosyltransferase
MSRRGNLAEQRGRPQIAGDAAGGAAAKARPAADAIARSAEGTLGPPVVSLTCLACAYPLADGARFCRRCGERQPMARSLLVLDGGRELAPSADPAGSVEPPAPAERPPLIPMWGPLDDIRMRARRALAGPSEIEPPTPAVFRSFTEDSDWSPRAVPDRDAGVRPISVRMPGRCTHRPRSGRPAAVCAICGGIPNPRVVTARIVGSGAGDLPAEMSASETLSPSQRGWFFLGAIAVMAAFVAVPLATLILGIAAATALYLGVMIQRIRIFAVSMDRPDLIEVTDAEARAIPDAKLPIYTVLVPAYREPEVIGRLVESLRSLEYPIHKLDIKLLLEQDDPETLEAALAARPGPHLEIIRVPPVGPRTKPKACEVGLARARGQYVTIYDAEDQPEPLQLRRAIVAFRRHKDIACFQAILAYRNAGQNLITRWFTAEYAMWFRQFLPGLHRLGAPLPLGGTSNHFRRKVLRTVGGWDPYNVTEDADLGIRLARAGHRTAVLQSTTWEEANSDFVNWVKQRSRWYKGYLQTWLIHLRDPRRLWRELGPRGFIGFNLFVGGTPLVAILNPFFWALTAIWFLAHPPLVEALFPSWLYYAGLACLVAGNAVFLYGSLVSARATGRPDVVLAALLAPVYWVMMSIAAVKAVVQLVHAPSFWEKTTHGLDIRAAAQSVVRGPTA